MEFPCEEDGDCADCIIEGVECYTNEGDIIINVCYRLDMIYCCRCIQLWLFLFIVSTFKCKCKTH